MITFTISQIFILSKFRDDSSLPVFIKLLNVIYLISTFNMQKHRQIKNA